MPYVVAKTIGITVTPTYKEGKVYASNTPTRNEKRIALYTVSLNADKLPFAMYNKLMGRSVDKNGVQIIKSGQVAPNVAIAFALTLDDGTKELWWLYKGTFSEPAVTGATENDGSTYQHPTIEGIFVRRGRSAGGGGGHGEQDHHAHGGKQLVREGLRRIEVRRSAYGAGKASPARAGH